MAVKKSELYSSIWKSCDELRGGMDASQYKDYVLILLFIKYISDKYAGVPYAPIKIPKGASFKDLVALKGKKTIGDDINKKIIGKIAEENKLTGTIDVADFNNPDKLGSGDQMVKRLTNLIAIFENPALDFSKNKADGDDILGDAYEYLMMHFATESGKSKGQFYTPAGVSKILAKVIGINPKNSSPDTTVYDPTCGSGSLLLKVGDEAEKNISLFGQEMDVATSALARMNMVLHNNPTAVQRIKQGNTLAEPKWKDGNALKQFDYVVANPPFSFKSWSTGLTPDSDPYGRFQDFGVPPTKNGDYAFLLHILRSLKSKGKGAVILPHGVLFRGNAEAVIRKNLIERGYIKGIIGLPANLFYGTGIPACIIIVDKEKAGNERPIFMIDAGKGFIKDGNKNRLRDQDIHRIVDVFNKQDESDPKFARLIPYDEIIKNEFNLNIPRYIDSQEEEDKQDIEAHLLGGIPNFDVDSLKKYWEAYPKMKVDLFKKGSRANYSEIKVEKDKINDLIFNHPDFLTFSKEVQDVFEKWKKTTSKKLKEIKAGVNPKEAIFEISETILKSFSSEPLIDKYDIYQHLMTYWSEVMQDDFYVISGDGWEIANKVSRIIKETKKKDKVTKKEVPGIAGLDGILIPPSLIIETYFKSEQKAIDELNNQKEVLASKMEELKEEHSGEEGLLSEVIDSDKISKTAVQKRIKDLNKDSADDQDELKVLKEYFSCFDDESKANAKIKELEKELEGKIIKQYPKLSETDVKKLVVEDKWLAAIEKSVYLEMDRISHRLTQRIKDLADRYEATMPKLTESVVDLEKQVNSHLEKMGFLWE